MRRTILSASIQVAFDDLGFAGASSLVGRPSYPPGIDRPSALVPDLYPNGRAVRVRWGPNHLTDEIYDFSTWLGEDVWERATGWHSKPRLLEMRGTTKAIIND